MSASSQNPPKQYRDFAVQTEELAAPVLVVKPSGPCTRIGSEPSETSSQSSPPPSDAPLVATPSMRGSKRYDGLPTRRPAQGRRITSMPASGPPGDRPTARILSLPVPRQGGDPETHSPHPSDEYDTDDELDQFHQPEDGTFANFRESMLLGLPRTPSPRTPPDGHGLDFGYDPCFEAAYTHPDSVWQGSPPRPIPALHGPLSLPYARCPSGAEGTVVDGDNLSHKVWGLGGDEQSTPREYQSPEINTPTWSSQEYNISWQLIEMNQSPRDLAPLGLPSRPIHTSSSSGIPNRPIHISSSGGQSIQHQQQVLANYSRPVGLSHARQQTRSGIEDPLSLGVGDFHPFMRQLQAAHPLSRHPMPNGPPLGNPGSDVFPSPELSPLNFGYKLESVPPAFRQPRPREHASASRHFSTPLHLSPLTRPGPVGWASSVASWSPDLCSDELYQSLLPQHAHRKPALLGTENRSSDPGLDYGLRPDVATAIVRSKTQSEFAKSILPDTTLPAKPHSTSVHSTSGDRYIGAKPFETRHPSEDLRPAGSHNMLTRTSMLSSGMIQAPRSVPLARLVQRRLSSVPEEGKPAFGIESMDPHESRKDIVDGNARKSLDWGRNRSSQKENTNAAIDQAYNSGVRNAPKAVQGRNRPARATPYKKRYPTDHLNGNRDADKM